MKLNLSLHHLLFVALFLTRSGDCILKYKIRMSKFCNKTQHGILRNTGLSLSDCVHGCTTRFACEGLEYYRKYTLCVLLAQKTSLGQGVEDTMEPCVVIEKENIMSPSTCSCTDNQVCELSDGGLTCVIKDCEPIYEAVNGKIYGNMHGLGSKLTYSCNKNYINNNNGFTLICLNTGHSDKQPRCIVECKDPSVGENVQLSEGNTIGGSIRTYTCSTGFYYGVEGEYVTTVTTECLQTGTWSLDGVNCVEGSHIRGSCTESAPCVDAHSLCLDSTCFCHAMFRYDQTIEKCVKRCTNIQDDFDLIIGVNFHGLNDWTLYTDDIDECKAKCIANSECFHVEDWTSQDDEPHCNLGRVSFQAVVEIKPGNLIPGNAIYIRKCT